MQGRDAPSKSCCTVCLKCHAPLVLHAGEEGAGAAAKPPLSHDDIWSIGERVCPEEADMIKTQVRRLYRKCARTISLPVYSSLTTTNRIPEELDLWSRYRNGTGDG